MKTNFFETKRVICLRLFILFLLFLMSSLSSGVKGKIIQQKVISYVDTSLNGSQKYVLRVDGAPFYMTNVQVRFDKLRYRWNWDIATCERLLKETASLDFNTLSIPIHWVEVEPYKDQFDWTTLDLYLGMAQKYGFKVELLWFGQNSGGHVQWLKADQLRTPDYVMHSPKAGDFQSFSTEGSSKETSSEYRICRDISDYTLDLNDIKLREREAYVIGKVMEHVSQWDIENGSKHTVIGVQLNNEVRSFPSSVIVAYMSELGRAVKQSSYSVWTRMNCTFTDLYSVLYCNEQLRFTVGTYIDYVGIDAYCNDQDGPDVYMESMRSNIPYLGKNYRMIMEAGAEMPNIAQLQIAALSGNTAFDYYELCGPDERGIFVKDEKDYFVPRSAYIKNEVKAVNKMLNSVRTDIALNANGYGLFVHNWKGESFMPTIGVEGIKFTPGYINSQALSIVRSGSEIILATTKGGVFSWTEDVGVVSASKGYFNFDNEWIDEGNVDFYINKSKQVYILEAPSGQIIRLLRHEQKRPSAIYPAEHAEFGDGVALEADITNCLGFSGGGYLNFPLAGGYALWTNIDGQNGGKKNIRLRYSNGNSKTNNPRLMINGVIRNISLQPTGAWNIYKYADIMVELKPGMQNTVRLESTWTGAGHVDELQIMEL